MTDKISHCYPDFVCVLAGTEQHSECKHFGRLGASEVCRYADRRMRCHNLAAQAEARKTLEADK